MLLFLEKSNHRTFFSHDVLSIIILSHNYYSKLIEIIYFWSTNASLYSEFSLLKRYLYLLKLFCTGDNKNDKFKYAFLHSPLPLFIFFSSTKLIYLYLCKKKCKVRNKKSSTIHTVVNFAEVLNQSILLRFYEITSMTLSR